MRSTSRPSPQSAKLRPRRQPAARRSTPRRRHTDCATSPACGPLGRRPNGLRCFARSRASRGHWPHLRGRPSDSPRRRTRAHRRAARASLGCYGVPGRCRGRISNHSDRWAARVRKPLIIGFALMLAACAAPLHPTHLGRAMDWARLDFIGGYAQPGLHQRLEEREHLWRVVDRSCDSATDAFAIVKSHGLT